MFKFINLILCFILINNYCQTKDLKSLYIEDAEFEKVSNIKYEYNKKDEFLNKLNFMNKDLDTSASENNEITADKRFQNWFDIGEYSNQTAAQSSTNKLESNLINKNDLTVDNKSLNSKKKWRLISSSILSDTIDNLNTPTNITTFKQKKSLKKQRKSRKLKSANLDFKLKDTNYKEDNYIKNKIANTSIYTINKKGNLKFKLNDAINFKNNDNLNRITSNNKSISLSVPKSDDQLNRRSQLTSSSSKIHKKIMFAASMLPLVKSLTSHTQVAVLPTAIAQPSPIALLPQPMPVPISVNLPQVHIVQPRPIYQQVIARPPPPPQQIITQPIIQQPIIHRKIIQQPVIISRPIQVVRKIRAQPQIYQTLQIPAVDQNCNQQVAEVDDSNEETTIQDPVDDDDNSIQADDDSSFSQDSWGNPQQQDQQVRIVPQQPIITQPQQDSWGNSNAQNQKIYTYHTASVPKKTRTIYTQTKMIPQTVHTHVYSQTSYTPEHRHTVVETEHNIKPVMSLVSAGQRKIITKPVYTVKTIQQPIMQTVQPTYVSNNQQSWSN